MNLCAGNRKHNHDEVCFEDRDCPVCSALDEMSDAQYKVEKLEKDNEVLGNNNTDLERRIEELERKIVELEREPVLTDIKAANGMFKDT